MSCLGLLKESITLFEWTKIYVALFEYLGLLEVNRKETPITGARNPQTIVHHISGIDDILHTNQSSVCGPYKAHGSLEQVVSCLEMLKETIALF